MRGGKRLGAGRPAGSGRYGEPTVPMRIPQSLVGSVADLIASHSPTPSSGLAPEASPQPRLVFERNGCQVWSASDAINTLQAVQGSALRAQTVILDPWYSPSPHRFRRHSLSLVLELIRLSGQIAQHVFLWGWPADVAPLIERIPPPLVFRHWLTWHYTNVPSRSKGWRPTQQACLHLSLRGARLFPGNIQSSSGLFRAGADSVITTGALTGFAGRSQSVGHPAQKPTDVIRPLILMSTQPGDLVLDPMAGSGTTGVVCMNEGRQAVLCDHRSTYIRMMEKRLRDI